MSMIIEYQRAIFSALTADNTLMAAITNVYDSVPQNAVAPYVYFAEVEAEENGNLRYAAKKISFRIICVTDNSGKAQAAEISALIQSVIRNDNLTVADYEHINTRLISEEISLLSGTNYIAELVYEGVVRG